MDLHIAPYAGPRARLRRLFRLAEDSDVALDGYIDAGDVLVATIGDAIVGHLQLTTTDDPAVVEIKNMAVRPAHQGSGIGRTLVAAAARMAACDGRTRLLVATAAADVGNLRFYQRQGFRMQSVERDAFTAEAGYHGEAIDGIPRRDRIWVGLSREGRIVTAQHGRRSPSDVELYGHGAATLVASWAEYARNARGAAVRRLPGVAAAVFAGEPERSVYNNALLDRDLPAAARAQAVEALEAVYTEAGITRYAAWVHECDTAMRSEFERRRYVIDTTTRAMGMRLDRLAEPRPELVLAALGWDDHLRTFGLPPGLLTGGCRNGLRVLTACLAGEPVATAMAYDLDGDCGVYNVTTLPHARRRGLGTALTMLLLHDARARGCRSASLQSTPMAERVYAAAGFRDLGRFIEYVPAVSGR